MTFKMILTTALIMSSIIARAELTPTDEVYDKREEGLCTIIVDAFTKANPSYLSEQRAQLTKECHATVSIYTPVEKKFEASTLSSDTDCDYTASSKAAHLACTDAGGTDCKIVSQTATRLILRSEVIYKCQTIVHTTTARKSKTRRALKKEMCQVITEQCSNAHNPYKIAELSSALYCD